MTSIDRMDPGRVGRIRVAELLGERSLRRVRVPGRHAAHPSVLVLDVDETEVGQDGDGDLGEAFDHLAVVGHLREHLRGEQQELVSLPGLEELVDELLALGRLGRGMQQLAEVATDGVHQLHHRGIALALVPAQHLDDPDARPPVADREGVRALQPVLHQGIGHEATVAHEVGDPQGLAVLDDPARQALASARRIRRLLPCEGGCDGRRARPDMPTDQLLVGRDGPQRGHVPIEAAPQRREQPLCRGVVDRRVGQDLDQLGRQFRPALQLPVVTGSEDADDHPSGERVVEHAEHQLGVDLGPVGALDDRRQAPAEESFGLVVEERFESLLEPVAAQ